MAGIKLDVNGTVHHVSVPPDTPLLWVIRDTLGLTGTKFGCGIGQCGSCAVLMDGEPVRSCVTTAGEAEGRSITTIEGLASSEIGRALQRAWIAGEVPQCGYCQSGQLIAASDLLAQHPSPTDAQIDEAMSGILCRCGTYRRIRRAIHQAAREAHRDAGA